MSLMPGPEGTLYNRDIGFVSWAAMVCLDHRYNNPVGVVFTSLLIEQLREQRGVAILHQVLDDAMLHRRSEGRSRWRRALWAWRRQRWLRWRRARNRWQLALFLLQNEPVRAYRRRGAPTGAATAPDAGGSQAEKEQRLARDDTHTASAKFQLARVFPSARDGGEDQSKLTSALI